MSEKIEDFGRVIPGAAKHRAAAWLEKMDFMGEESLHTQPLSKAFPHPDYASLLEEGHSPLKLGLIRVIRENLPTRPRGNDAYAARNQAAWAAAVRQIRSACIVMLSDMNFDDERVEVIAARTSPTSAGQPNPILMKARAYAALGHGKSLINVGLRKTILWGQLHYVFGEKSDMKVPNASLTPEGALEKFIERMQHAPEEAAPKRKAARPKFYTTPLAGGAVALCSKLGRNGAVRLGQFESRVSAVQWLNANMEAATERVIKAREAIDFRRETNDPRNGPRRRTGDVTPDDFMEMFGFSGVQFGNYVEGARRQEDLNNTWDSLMDLAEAIECDPSSLSIGGKLALAFGARGKGGKGAAAAHYEPGETVINLTKGNGAGCFAHEWFHAVDNLVARQLGSSALSYHTQTSAFARVIASQPVCERSRQLDRYRSSDYYSTTIEMAARAFETLVIQRLAEKGISNDWLANVLDRKTYDALCVLQGKEGDLYPYPDGEAEIRRIEPALQSTIDDARKAGLLHELKSVPQPAPEEEITEDELEPHMEEDGQLRFW